MPCVDKKKIESKGKLYGIGIGPGDPELITVKAVQLLKKVDVIFAPCAGIKSKSYAFEIVKKYISKRKVKTIVFPMSKNEKTLKGFWQKAALEVYGKILQGKNAAFITIGDPMIYSTYIYLSRYVRKLDKDIEIHTIPGISVVSAIASLFSVPLAEGGEKFAVLPLPEKLLGLKEALKQFDTVVLLKIGKNLKSLTEFLKKEKLKYTFYFAKRIGRCGQYITKDISKFDNCQKTTGYMSTMIIRKKKRGFQ